MVAGCGIDFVELMLAYIKGRTLEYFDGSSWREVAPYTEQDDLYRLSKVTYLFRLKMG